jgi:hypothetical protein
LALKKQQFAEDEIPIFDEACTYKRGEYWQFRMWLPKENKYARKSLRTRSEAAAIEKGNAAYLEIYANLQKGKSYFSITTKEVVEKYLALLLACLKSLWLKAEKLKRSNSLEFNIHTKVLRKVAI